MQTKTISSRLSVVDSLRGVALLAIVLLHNIEHYNLFCIPENMPEWLNFIDKGVWETIFFLLAGKAYATFSFLFGFSFYIQYTNEQKRGGDFRARFAWRMFILFLFSQLHALLYNGDILLLYSVVGLTLIPVCRLKDKTVLIIASILLLQPFEWGRIIYCAINPDFVISGKMFMKYAMLSEPVMQTGNVAQVIKSNIFDGQMYSNLWQVENGRFFQTAALFMFGLLAGRRKVFVKSDESIFFWEKTLLYSAIAYLPLLILKIFIPELIDNKSILISYNIAVPSLVNFSFMLILISSFTLSWFKKDGYAIQRIFIPYGRMSLTNYITQSYMGVFIYYTMGLGLYKYTGATASVLIGLAIFTVQLIFSRYWLSKHNHGPFEYIWRKATWIGK